MLFSEFKTAIKTIAFPKGEAENLVTIHDQYIQDALVDIQRWVPCFQKRNVSAFEQCRTKYFRGLTVVPEPCGDVARVYTVNRLTLREPVYYHKRTIRQLEEMAARYDTEIGLPDEPDNTDLPVLPPGFKYPNDSTDDDLNRSVVGFYAYQDGLVYIWPYIQSWETLIIEWKGIKNSYTDYEEIFSEDPWIARAVRAFLKQEIARDILCDGNELEKFQQEYQTRLADLMWKCNTTEISGERENITIARVCTPIPTEEGDSPVLPTTRNTVIGPFQFLETEEDIDLAYDRTYLNAAGGDTFTIEIPDGTYPRQRHSIFIPKTRIDRQDSVTWVVEGTFINFEDLTFNNIGHSAVLEWDGAAWHLVGGNAAKGEPTGGGGGPPTITCIEGGPGECLEAFDGEPIET